MNVKLLFIASVIIALLVAACGPQPETQPQQQQPPPVQEQKPVVQQPVQEQPTQPKVEAPKEPTKEVKDLLALRTKIKSFKTIIDDGTPGAVTIIVRGDKIRKFITIPRTYNKDTFVNEVFIDRAAKTAYGICTDNFACPIERQKKAYPQNFAQEDVVTPLDLMNGVTYAEKVGEEQFNNRNTAIVEFTNPEGKRERLWLDAFYGVPLQQKIFEGEIDGETEIEKHTFTETAFNTYSDEDVSLPQGTEIVE